jgi:5-methylcytosine-specific restriction protein A
MATILMTWNPAGWHTDAYDEWVERTQSGELVPEPWSVANRRYGVDRGDRALLLRQGDAGRGLVGIGAIQCPPYEDGHWSGDGRTAWYVDILWSEFLPLDRMITVAELEAAAPEFGWRTVYASGRTVPDGTASRLEDMWRNRTLVGRVPTPSEILDNVILLEGSRQEVITTRYERNPEARRRCLEHYGYACRVCGFDFQAVYGDLGRGYAHVHHIEPLHTLGAEHEVDPVMDLRPVCANCHYMLHRSEDPILTPDELRDRLRGSRTPA